MSAQVGDMIKVKVGEKKGKRGQVVTVRENSVIVEFGTNEKGVPIRTVVNHKNYISE
ncbi:DUF2187 domain-containing protein [Bacillus sp. HMF5848]|uniref:DUF2187 family protein n=1 Tax=Bacillus sp. HMF5848 TaxID=2495421 RepID=UPI000F771B8E|nr:DUF2187 family protein [Bacillus sp. HMF5848]RSK28417.1 DUF2187 domain-containing protein [Bacillus sp. HMF5848]